MTAMTQRENSGGNAGKRIAAAALLGFSLGLATAQAQVANDLPPLENPICWTCESPNEFRLGDYSQLREPIIDPATGDPFPNNRIPLARLLAHGAWPEDIYERNSGIFGIGGRFAGGRWRIGAIVQRVAQGWTPLHETVFNGSPTHPLGWLNPAHLDRVLDDWSDALDSGLRNAPWFTGQTPLLLAATSPDPGIVERLLARGASVHARDSRGLTPLLWANSREAFEALRAAGADIRAQANDGWTVLHRAASFGDAATVRELLDAGLNPNAETSDGWTPLLFAGSYETFEALRAAGADPNARTDNGSTVLHRAASLGDAEWVQELLDAGLNPNAENDWGAMPWHEAGSREAFEALRAAGANLAVIEEAFGPDKLVEATQTSPAGHAQQRLLHRAVRLVGRYLDAAWLPRLRAVNPNFCAVTNSGGGLPLHYAAQYNEDPAAIAALLGDGVDVNSLGWGRTALAYAARDNPNPAVVEALLAAGADVNAPSGSYEHYADTTALYEAVQNQTPRAAEIVRVLLEADADLDGSGWPPPLYAAAMTQNLATLDALSEAGADVNTTGSSGYHSLLADVLSRGRFDCGYGPVAERLHAAGAQATVGGGAFGSVRPFTPGPQVVECDPVSAEIQALIDAGADLDVQDERGETALHRAAAAGRIADIRALVAAGAEVDAASRGGGLRALHFAIWRQAGLATVTALLEAGADVNARDSRGGTALHWAARIRQVEPAVVEALLAAGAEVHARDNLGQTALDYATRANIANEAVAALLRAAGED